MRKNMHLIIAVALVLSGATTASYALNDETKAAIQGALLVGTAVDKGDVKPGVIRAVVRGLRHDGAANSEIRDVIRAVFDKPRPKGAGPGLGEFVKEAHARGLKGKELAAAIHREQARRGVPGQAKKEEGDIVGKPGKDRAKENHPDNTPASRGGSHKPGHAAGKGGRP